MAAVHASQGGAAKMPRQQQHAQPAQPPNREPIDAEGRFARPQQRRHADRRRREGANFRIEARRTAALDQRRPRQQLAMPGVISHKNEIGTKEIAGIPAARVSAYDQGEIGGQQYADHQQCRAEPTGFRRLGAGRQRRPGGIIANRRSHGRCLVWCFGGPGFCGFIGCHCWLVQQCRTATSRNTAGQASSGTQREIVAVMADSLLMPHGARQAVAALRPLDLGSCRDRRWPRRQK